MGKIVDVVEQLITTNDGQKFIRRVKKVEMPNGKFRYPVDYYDASPVPVTVTHAEMERIRIPVYKRLIP